MNNKYIFGLHPLSESNTPDYYQVWFENWIEESITCLRDRSEEELAKILLAIDINCLHGESLLNEDENLSYKNIVKLFSSGLYPGRSQILYLLHLKASGTDPMGFVNIPNLTWEECFAVILLGKVKFALVAENILKEGVFNSDSEDARQLGCNAFYDLGEYMGAFALDCMEIHSILAGLPGRDTGRYKLPLKATRSTQSKKANDEKYKNSRDAKERFFTWYDGSRASFDSNVDAIMEYLANKISDEDRVLIRSSRMLEDALRDRKRKYPNK